MRIKQEVIDINEEQTLNFWEKRADRGLNLKTVLLNESLDDSIIRKRNFKESDIVKSILPKQSSVLDIGCGIGRWADNLKEHISFYHGIDYTESLISIAKQRFKENKNVDFIKMSASNIDKAMLRSQYDMTIITGVLMYINDKNIPNLLNFIDNVTTDTIYVQESMSINTRLTLDNIYSDNLKDNYSAIYITKEEYETFYKNNLKHFKIKKVDLLLDDDMAPHKETNAMYWILKRI